VRDGPGRRFLKASALIVFRANLALDRRRRRWRGDLPHLLGGACQRCARCCEEPSIRSTRLVFHLRSLRALFLAWQRHVNGFVLTRAEAGSRTFVFRCTHFDLATRSCDSYASRPGMCRDYPRVLLFQARPVFLSGCGYRAHPPNAPGLRSALEARGLPPEQLAKLRRDLDL
jgi:hypothetical protein